MAAIPPEQDHDWREGRIRLPVRIGVIGHRDLAEPEAVAARLGELLRQIAASFGDSSQSDVRFVVMSSLAEGADRLFVDQAFLTLGEDGVELDAVLPLEAEDFERDFATAESRTEFARLLGRATARVLPPHSGGRDEAYAEAGRWLVDHSDLVIAVWDGYPASGRGGTAESALYARSTDIPVVAVPAKRIGHPDRPAQLPSWQPPLATVLEPILAAYRQVQELNRGSARSGSIAAKVDDLQTRIGDAAQGSAVHWMYEIVADWALPRMARADLLAARYQRRYVRLGEMLYAMSALAVAAVAAQAEANLSALFALIEVALMFVVLMIFWAGRRSRVHERWIGYRSLAEAFRSGLFIHLTGAEISSVRLEEESSLGKEPWFQRAFFEAWRERPALPGEPPPSAELTSFLVDAWLDDQVGYHEHAVHRFEAAYRRLNMVIFILFASTFVVGLLHSFQVVDGDTWTRLFVFLAVALPGFGAALTGVRDQRQYRRHAERSRSTASRLDALKRGLSGEATPQTAQRLAVQIHTIVESENLDWSGVIEFQDLEMVI
jgi:hypothetical protein